MHVDVFCTHCVCLPGSQYAGEKRGVAGLLLGRTERAARAAELQLCAQADAGRDWGQEEKGTTEDEMAGWHH